MESVLQLLIDSGILPYLFSVVLTIIIGYIAGKGISLKEIEDIISTVKESYDDGYISPEEAQKIYKEIEDVIGRDWYIRLYKLLKR